MEGIVTKTLTEAIILPLLFIALVRQPHIDHIAGPRTWSDSRDI